MDGLKILAVVLLLYGPLGIALAVFEIQAVVWNMGKIEGFESLLGEVGTRVLLGVWGVGGFALGVWSLARLGRAAARPPPRA